MLKQTIKDKTGVLAATIIKGLEFQYLNSKDETISFLDKASRVIRSPYNVHYEGNQKYIAVLAHYDLLDEESMTDEEILRHPGINEVYVIDKVAGILEVYSQATDAEAMDIIEGLRENVDHKIYVEFKFMLGKQPVCLFCGRNLVDLQSNQIIVSDAHGSICLACSNVATTMLIEQKPDALIQHHPSWFKTKGGN